MDLKNIFEVFVFAVFVAHLNDEIFSWLASKQQQQQPIRGFLCLLVFSGGVSLSLTLSFHANCSHYCNIIGSFLDCIADANG